MPHTMNHPQPHQTMAEPSWSGCDDSFGPFAANCTSPRFDFTLRFEQSILSIAPCALLLVCVLPRLGHLARESPKVEPRSLRHAKTVVYSCLVGLQLASLVLWSKRAWFSSSVSIAAATFNLLGAIALTALSPLEFSRSVRPSAIILVYLIFSIAFDAAQCRTLWLVRERVIAPVYTAGLATKVLVLLLELQEKHGFLLRPWKHLNRETTSSIINKSVFWWLNGLLLRGFRATLSGDSLYDTDAALKSRRLLRKIQDARHNWASPKSRILRRHKLLFALLDTVRESLILAALPRVCLIGFKVAQPFLLQRVVNYTANDKNDDPDKRTGYALIGATALVYTGIAISNGFYQHQIFRSLTMVRGALVSLVYKHTLSAVAISSGTGSAPKTPTSASLTLIGPDVMAITNALEKIHELWANPVEILLAIWLLSRALGPGSVGPVVAVVVCSFAMSKLSKRMGPAMKSWNTAIQSRISTTSGVLTHIKEAKMLGTVPYWLDRIHDLRVIELGKSKKFRTLIAYMNMLGNAPVAVSPIVTFGIALAVQNKTGDQLDLTTAFTSLSIIGLIVSPLSHLLYAVPLFSSCFGSFERIESFVSRGQAGQVERVANSDSGSEPPDLALRPSRHLLERYVIKAANVSFVLPGQNEPVLKNLMFSVKHAAITLVTGPVGSGKSMLLLGILGEMESSGDLSRSFSSISYCSQQTWLIKDSIKNNIVGPDVREIDEIWYRKVIAACVLTKDLERLPFGDGTNALTLSGGQKQRVALARALYARRSMLIADDVFSGLDADTRHHVWTQVFGPNGLLRQASCTSIISTHLLEYVKDVDHVIMMNKGGITQQGSYAALHHMGAFTEAVDATGFHGPSANTTSIEEEMPVASTTEPRDDDEQEAEDIATNGDFSLYLFYFRSIGWKFGLTAICLAMFSAFLQQFTQIWLKWWTEPSTTGSRKDHGLYYGVYAALLSLYILAIGLDCWFMFVNLIPHSAAWLHRKLLETTLRATMSFFYQTDNGDLINRFTQDMTLVDRELPTAIYTTLSALLVCIGESILITLGSKYLAATLPAFLAILYVLQKFYLATSRQLRILDLQAKAPLYRHLLQTIDGLVTIRAFRWQDVTAQKSLDLLDSSQRPHYLLFSVQRWLTLVLDLLVTISATLLVLFAVVTNSTSAGYMAVAMYSIIGFSESLSNLLTSWTSLETSLGAISRLKTFVKKTPQELEPSWEHRAHPPTGWPSEGEIVWENVQAQYEIAQGEGSASPILHAVSFTISPGQKVAICGRTGSGKSSLLATVLKMIDYTGTIRIDGHDIANISNAVLRSSLNVISQHPVLFPGSLRSNLILLDLHVGDNTTRRLPIDDEKIISVLENLKIWDSIQQHGSLDTDAENLSLSIGQKQLVCLARAILRKTESNILILDEAMSAVDAETETVMVETLEREFANHTVLSVVHRLNTVRKYDTMVVLESGRIVTVGSPRNLVDETGHLVKGVRIDS